MLEPLRRKAFALLLLVLVGLELLGCGTILYPERRGQRAGRYDTDVVILDAVGLVFFLVPGVIAFAVDFATGAIYLPPGEKSRVFERFGRVGQLELDLKRRDVEAIVRLVTAETGTQIALDALQTVPSDGSCSDVQACVARLDAWTKAASDRAG